MRNVSRRQTEILSYRAVLHAASCIAALTATSVPCPDTGALPHRRPAQPQSSMGSSSLGALGSLLLRMPLMVLLHCAELPPGIARVFQHMRVEGQKLHPVPCNGQNNRCHAVSDSPDGVCHPAKPGTDSVCAREDCYGAGRMLHSRASLAVYEQPERPGNCLTKG